MRKLQLNKPQREELVDLKNNEWLERQKQAGRCVAEILQSFRKLVEGHEPNLNLLDLERMALIIMESRNCTPTFKDYGGSSSKPAFPGAVCLSVNNELVHGVPKDYILQEGDVVSMDLGATYEGAIADAARTYIYGEPKHSEHVRLLETCRGSLKAAIDAIEIGKRLGVIGDRIHKYCKDSGFKIVVNYGGHGINYNVPHADPFVANKAQKDEGIRIRPGLSIAIEPMLVIGELKTRVSEEDKWTVLTPGIGCHFENSVTIMEDGKYVVTETEENE